MSWMDQWCAENMILGKHENWLHELTTQSRYLVMTGPKAFETEVWTAWYWARGRSSKGSNWFHQSPILGSESTWVQCTGGGWWWARGRLWSGSCWLHLLLLPAGENILLNILLLVRISCCRCLLRISCYLVAVAWWEYHHLAINVKLAKNASWKKHLWV